MENTPVSLVRFGLVLVEDIVERRQAGRLIMKSFIKSFLSSLNNLITFLVLYRQYYTTLDSLEKHFSIEAKIHHYTSNLKNNKYHDKHLLALFIKNALASSS